MDISLIDIFKSFDYTLSSEKCEKLNRFYELLIDWNERINLTAITDHDEVVWKHFIDSASVLFKPDTEKEYFTDEENELFGSKTEACEAITSEAPFPLRRFRAMLENDPVRLLDVGTGAGFPGIVLGILDPAWQITLLDSLNKRAEFLKTVISELSLENISVIHGRAEDIGRDADHRLSYDLVVSRAVASLPVLLELCMPFVSDKGFFVSYKGPDHESDLSRSAHAMSELKVAERFICGYRFRDNERVLIGFEHDGVFPDKYPRRPGIPGKRPL